MKTGLIFCVLSVICLFGAGNAENDPEGDEVIETLRTDLRKQERDEYNDHQELVTDAISKLESAAADARHRGRNDQGLCMAKAIQILNEANKKYRKKLSDCSEKIVKDVESWLSKRRRDTSRLRISAHVTIELIKASACNKHGTLALRSAVRKARPSLNKSCSKPTPDEDQNIPPPEYLEERPPPPENLQQRQPQHGDQRPPHPPPRENRPPPPPPRENRPPPPPLRENRPPPPPPGEHRPPH